MKEPLLKYGHPKIIYRSIWSSQCSICNITHHKDQTEQHIFATCLISNIIESPLRFISTIPKWKKYNRFQWHMSLLIQKGPHQKEICLVKRHLGLKINHDTYLFRLNVKKNKC